jgi:hypothetical protein
MGQSKLKQLFWVKVTERREPLGCSSPPPLKMRPQTSKPKIPSPLGDPPSLLNSQYLLGICTHSPGRNEIEMQDPRILIYSQLIQVP